MRSVRRNSVGDAAISIGGNPVKDLADDLRELASPIERGEKITVAIERAARSAGLGHWRVFNIWYGKARGVDVAEIAAVALALDHKRRAERRCELQQLWARLAQLESSLAISDPDFHRPSIEAVHDHLRGARRR